MTKRRTSLLGVLAIGTYVIYFATGEGNEINLNSSVITTKD